MLTESAYEIVQENKLKGRDDSEFSRNFINSVKEIRARGKIDAERRKKMREDLYKKTYPNSEQGKGLEIIDKFLDKYFPKTLLERFENTKEQFMNKFTSSGQNDRLDQYNVKYGTNIPHMKSEFDMRVEPELERMRQEEQPQVLGSEESSRESIERFMGILKNDFSNPVETIPDSVLQELNAVLPFINTDGDFKNLPYTAEEEAEDDFNNEFKNPSEDDIQIFDMIDKDKRKVRIGESISF